MSRKRPFTYEQFKEIYSKVPRLCVEVLVQTDEGFVLTLRKADGWENQWHIPGGTVFYKERVADAVKRIAKEELGVEIEPQGLVGFIEYPSEEKIRGFGWSIGLAVLCVLSSGTLNQDTEEVAKIFKDLPENMIAEQRKFLENFLHDSCSNPDCNEH